MNACPFCEADLTGKTVSVHLEQCHAFEDQWREGVQERLGAGGGAA